jgi:hypothetical protein
MNHHTGFVERRLSIEDNDVSIPDMPVDLLVPSWWTNTGTSIVALSRKELIGNCRPLL